MSTSAHSSGAAGAEGQSLEAPSARSKDSADLLAEDEDALRTAAWRWRFNRRWAQEQARQMDPDYGRQVSMHPPPSACAPHVTDAPQQIDVTSARA